MLVSINNKPLQPAIRGFPTSYDSEVRKWCQHSLFRAFRHRERSSYTSFRLESRFIHHRDLTVWVTIHQICLQHFILRRHTRLLHNHPVTPYTQLPGLLRIFQTNKNFIAFNDKFLHLSHEAAFLSYNLWRFATTWLRFYRKSAFYKKVASFCAFSNPFLYHSISLQAERG